MPSFSVWLESNTSIWKSSSTNLFFFCDLCPREQKNKTSNQSKLEQAGQMLEKTRNQRQPGKKKSDWWVCGYMKTLFSWIIGLHFLSLWHDTENRLDTCNCVKADPLQIQHWCRGCEKALYQAGSNKTQQSPKILQISYKN